MHTVKDNSLATISTRVQRKPCWHLLCVFSSALATLSVNAQSAEQTIQLEEIIVTASKRAQSLNEFSGSISVINAETLNSPSFGLSDLANQVPGFSMLDAGPRNPASLIMRGLRVDEVGPNDLGGDGGSVASYVDNIPLQGYFLPPGFSFKDLQQVEVLRGPQGTLYGNSSIGGLIRYITAKPELTKPSLNIATSVSQTEESDGVNYEADLVVNAPLITDELGVRVLLGKAQNEGFIDNPYLLTGAAEDINDDKTRQARVSMRWQPTNEFSIDGSYHFQKINVGDRQAANPSFTGDGYTASNHYSQPMEGELRLTSLDANYDFNWATLTASVSRYSYENVGMVDQTDYLLMIDEIYEEAYYSLYEDFSAFGLNDVTVDKDSVELRLVSPAEQSLRWLVGTFYSTDDADLVGADVVPGFADFWGTNRPDNIDLYYTQTENLKERSLYAEVAYDLTSAWEVLLGARSFRYEDEFESCSVFPFWIEGTDLPLDCVGGDDVHTGSLGKFSTKYQFTPTRNIYLTVAEGYRRGGANPIPATIDYGHTYSPDSSINYEIGTHSSFINQRLQINAAVFYIDWEDIQVSGAVEQQYGATFNARRARSQGVELEALAELTDYFSLRMGFSYTDAELTEDVMDYNGFGENIYKGDRLPGAPREQWNLGLGYARALGIAQLDTNFTVAYAGETYTALNDELADYERLKGHTTANARMGLTISAWRLGIFVNNIANARTITGKRSSDLYGERGQFEYINRPRTIGVSLNYRY